MHMELRAAMWFNSMAIGLVLHSIDQQALLLLMFLLVLFRMRDRVKRG